MMEEGHGSHWECVVNLIDIPQKVLFKLVKKGDVVEKAEVIADCFGNGKETKQSVFSISYSADLTAIALIVSNKKNQTNEVVSAYPIVRNGEKIKLKITSIKEWSNGIEAVIIAETEGKHKISFFDTKYFKNKHKYKIGETHTFLLAALAYSAEELKEKSFSFEGQTAIDWLAKSDREPDYDEKGNVKPIVFDLTELVAFLPRTDYPDDVEFQSPISEIENAEFLGSQVYKLKICIFRDLDTDQDVYIHLFAKKAFFEQKPKVNDAIRGILWMQGYLQES